MHRQITSKTTLFSPPKHGAKWGKIFTDWFKKCTDGYILSIWYKLVHFSLPLTPALHRMGNNLSSLCPRCKEREESHPHFIFHYRLSQTTLAFINKLINLNYTFWTPFKFSIKDIIIATSPHTHNGVKLEILQALTEVFHRHIIFCRRKAFYEDGYDKIQELSNFKGNLVSHYMSVELDSKESFLRKWNSLLNNILLYGLNLQTSYYIYVPILMKIKIDYY